MNDFNKLQHPFLTRLLNQAFNDKMPAALLFTGDDPQKVISAEYLSKYLLCTSPKQSEPCLQCKSCHFIEQGYHPDFMALGDSEGESVSVEDIRSLSLFFSKAKHTASHKVAIIYGADSLNASCQNALLKILEEPPKNTQFILLANSTHLLLPTIKSRCVQYKFLLHINSELEQQISQRIQEDDTFTRLAALSEPERLLLIHLSKGNVLEMQEWLESEVWANRQQLLDRFILGRDRAYTGLVSIINRFGQQALYFIYLALSHLIHAKMTDGTVNKLNFGPEYFALFNTSSTLEQYLNYLDEIQQGLKAIATIPGLNKLLLFQSLYVSRCRIS